MNIFVKRENGAITIFISLMLVSILSIGSLVLEAGRLQSARTQLNEATVSAETSVISNYDLTLNDRFGIMAFEDDADTKADFNDYLSFNSDLDAEYKGNNVTRLYALAEVEMDGIYNFTYPSVIKRQILSKTKYTKATYDFPINIDTLSSFWPEFRSKCSQAQSLISSLSKGTGSISGDYSSALNAVEKAFSSIYDYDKNCVVVIPDSEVSILPSKTGTITDTIPTEEISRIQSTLDEAKSLVGEYASSIGGVDSGVEEEETSIGITGDYSSTRTEMKKAVTGANYSLNNLATMSSDIIGKMSSVSSALGTNDNAETNMLINSYIADTFSNRAYLANGSVNPTRGTKSANNFSAACAEYIFAGNANETVNQQSAYWIIFYIRFVDNINLVSKSSGADNRTKFIWAFYETLVDMEVLTTHKGLVPLTKTSLFLPMSKASQIASQFSDMTVVETSLKNIGSVTTAERVAGDGNERLTTNGSGLADYTDYLSLALWFVPNTEKMLRISDLIQLEMRYRQKYVTNETVDFYMKNQNSYCRANVMAVFNSILPVISLSGNDRDMNGIKINAVKFVGY